MDVGRESRMDEYSEGKVFRGLSFVVDVDVEGRELGGKKEMPEDGSLSTKARGRETQVAVVTAEQGKSSNLFQETENTYCPGAQ